MRTIENLKMTQTPFRGKSKDYDKKIKIVSRVTLDR